MANPKSVKIALTAKQRTQIAKATGEDHTEVWLQPTGAGDFSAKALGNKTAPRKIAGIRPLRKFSAKRKAGITPLRKALVKRRIFAAKRRSLSATRRSFGRK